MAIADLGIRGVAVAFVGLLPQAFFYVAGELRNVVERSLIMAEGNALTVGCLSPEFHAASCDGSVPDSMALDALERHHILRVLEYTKGNKAEAARLLGIGIATLYRKLESYGMKP